MPNVLTKSGHLHEIHILVYSDISVLVRQESFYSMCFSWGRVSINNWLSSYLYPKYITAMTQFTPLNCEPWEHGFCYTCKNPIYLFHIIIWTDAGIFVIRTLGTNFSEILSQFHAFSLKNEFQNINCNCEMVVVLLWAQCVKAIRHRR